MESLLRWGIENSVPNPNATSTAPAPRKDIDPGIIDLILGKSDAELMKEALAIAIDESQTEEQRIEALDNLEMLVESIDNANNIEKLQMWQPLQTLLTPQSSEPLKAQTLWVIGTALQNNPSAQSSYLSVSPIPTLLACLSSKSSPKARSKAVYALSGILKHNVLALRAFDDASGWIALRKSLNDKDIAVRSKTAFLLNSLLVPSSNSHLSTSSSTPIHANSHASMLSDPSSTKTSPLTFTSLQKYNIVDEIIENLVSPPKVENVGGSDAEKAPDSEMEDEIERKEREDAHFQDFEQKLIRLLDTYLISCHGPLPSTSGSEPNPKSKLIEYFKKQSASEGGDKAICDRWGLEAGEWEALKGAVLAA